MANEIVTIEMIKDDGFVVEILVNHRLSENAVDEVCFLSFFAISCFLVVNQVAGYFFSPFSC